MVSGFSHSISLPLSPSKSCRSCAASNHVRSVSFPRSSHSIINHLEEQIRSIQSWSAKPEASSVWIEVSLAQIETLLTALEEFLQLCQTQEILRCAASTDGLLDAFLLLADIYGSFVSTLVTLKQYQSNVQSALRRADRICLVSALRSLRHLEKEISQLSLRLKNITKCRPLVLTTDVEITDILVEAVSTIAVASVALFSGVVAISASVSSTKTSSWIWFFRKATLNSLSNCKVSDEEFIVDEKLAELEVSFGNVQSSSERLFRKVINMRVSLLNISTASM